MGPHKFCCSSSECAKETNHLKHFQLCNIVDFYLIAKLNYAQFSKPLHGVMCSYCTVYFVWDTL